GARQHQPAGYAIMLPALHNVTPERILQMTKEQIDRSASLTDPHKQPTHTSQPERSHWSPPQPHHNSCMVCGSVYRFSIAFQLPPRHSVKRSFIRSIGKQVTCSLYSMEYWNICLLGNQKFA